MTDRVTSLKKFLYLMWGGEGQAAFASIVSFVQRSTNESYFQSISHAIIRSFLTTCVLVTSDNRVTIVIKMLAGVI